MAVIATVCLNFTSVAQNMVTNPGFENWTDGKPDGWFGAETHTTGLTVSQSDVAHEGSSSCQLTNTHTAHRRFTSKPLNVVGGQEYTVTFWLRGSGEVRTGFYDGRGSGGGDNYKYNSYITANGTWTQYTQTVTAIITTAEAELIFSVNSAGDVLIDDVEMTGGGGPITLKADFSADKTTAPVGSEIKFTDLSTGDIVAWAWTVAGPETMTSTEQHPAFTFTRAGSYDVKLVISSDEDSDTEIKADYINIGDFILLQNFDSGDFGNWETINVVGDQKWIISSNGGPDGSPCAQMNGYSGGNNANEDWLVSPEISATAFVLTFENTKSYNGDVLKLYVSENYSGNVTEATWTQLTFNASTNTQYPPAPSSWVNSGEVKYAPTSGKAHIAFKYISTTNDGALWRVDNIVVKDGNVNINEQSKAQCEIYPNPTDGQLTIDNGQLTIENVEIFDITGKCVATVETLRATSLQTTTTLDISHLTSGVYFVKIKTENGMITKKVVKN